MNNATEIADKFYQLASYLIIKQIKTPIDDFIRELNFSKAKKLSR
jgi:hypothetical protein